MLTKRVLPADRLLYVQANNQTGVQTLASSLTGVLLVLGRSLTGAQDLSTHQKRLHLSQRQWGSMCLHNLPSMLLKALAISPGEQYCVCKQNNLGMRAGAEGRACC